MAEERIDKILSGQGIATRSQAKELIRKGAVAVNGVTVRRPEEKYDPDTDSITVSGKDISYRKYLYIMMNKPAGVVSASRDSRMKTVLDLLPPELRRNGLFPAGRLDRDTTGLLLITDDGDLAHRMLSPKGHVWKQYRAVCTRELTQADAARFEEGITYGEESFLPARMKPCGGCEAIVEIHEGRFHQVKKMFLALGTEVVELERLRIGGLRLDPELERGECRELTRDEIAVIFGEYEGI